MKSSDTLIHALLELPVDVTRSELPCLGILPREPPAHGPEKGWWKRREPTVPQRHYVTKRMKNLAMSHVPWSSRIRAYQQNRNGGVECGVLDGAPNEGIIDRFHLLICELFAKNAGFNGGNFLETHK